MKKILLLALSIFTCSISFAQYNWQVLSTAPKSWRNDDVYFLTPQMGWAIHPYGALSLDAQIYGTKDGGNSWKLLKDMTWTYFRCVGFADSLTGWVGNLADTISGYTRDTVPLYQTTDGGNTWAPANLPHPHPPGICGISVVNDSVIYAYGRWFGPPYGQGGSYVKTANKGNTWTYKDMSTYAHGLVDGWFFNKDTGFIAGASPSYKAQILSTVDGGNTWNVCYRSTRADTDEVWKIFFPSRDTGYASIEYQGTTTENTMRFLKTTNGGLTWTEMIFSTFYFDEEGIGFINDTIGWIGGDPCSPNYITYDGGTTWSPDYGFGVQTPPYVQCNGYPVINRFRKLNDTLIYASGNTEYKLSGKTTGIKQLQSNKGNLENYPNPFTSQTTISYTLSGDCHNVRLEVFASMGQLIYSQNLGDQNAGVHEFKFDQGIPAGAYYYSIESNELTITRKMLRIK